LSHQEWGKAGGGMMLPNKPSSSALERTQSSLTKLSSFSNAAKNDVTSAAVYCGQLWSVQKKLWREPYSPGDPTVFSPCLILLKIAVTSALDKGPSPN